MRVTQQIPQQLTLDELASEDSEVRLTEPLLRPEEIARLLAVKPNWVYDRVRDGSLPFLRIGRSIRFTRAMIEAWLVHQRHG